jgi:hypothetical protein
MNTRSADMLIEARSTSRTTPTTAKFGHAENETLSSHDRCGSPNAFAIEELDAGGSEFSWSSIESGGSSPLAEISAPTPALEKNLEPESTAAHESTPPAMPDPSVRIDDTRESDPKSMVQMHSLYFWDSISFKVNLPSGLSTRSWLISLRLRV